MRGSAGAAGLVGENGSSREGRARRAGAGVGAGSVALADGRAGRAAVVGFWCAGRAGIIDRGGRDQSSLGFPEGGVGRPAVLGRVGALGVATEGEEDSGEDPTEGCSGEVATDRAGRSRLMVRLGEDVVESELSELDLDEDGDELVLRDGLEPESESELEDDEEELLLGREDSLE